MKKMLLQMTSGFLQLESAICPNLNNQMLRMHGSILGCKYLFQFKLGNVYRNSAKQATAMYNLPTVA
jgi:hypothetical protein